MIPHNDWNLRIVAMADAMALGMIEMMYGLLQL